MFQIQKALGAAVQAPLADMQQFNALTLPTIANLQQVQQLVPLPESIANGLTGGAAKSNGSVVGAAAQVLTSAALNNALTGATRRSMFGNQES